MKMLKKLLAVVLTGAMALTLLTACGSNAVNDKSIADALNDIVKSSVAAGLTRITPLSPGRMNKRWQKLSLRCPRRSGTQRGMGTINFLGQS